MAESKLPSLLSEEPYRLWFPLGILAGIAGVSVWPLWVGGWLETYPGPAHVRIMLEGFFAAFVFGFLGTAGPRMLEAKSFSFRHWIWIFAAWLIGQGSSLLGLADLAEGAFIVAVMLVLLGFGARFRSRRGLPPPGFVLVIASLILVVPAAATQMPLIQRALGDQLPVHVWLAGRAFLVEGFILLPILGTMPFFFGRFGGLPPAHDTVDDRLPDGEWRKRALVCSVLGILIIAAICLKSTGLARAGALLQAASTGAFLWTQVPFRYPRPTPTLGRIAQLAILCLVLAPLCEAIWPGTRMAWRHLLVIPGFQFVVVAVATWVAFAHAGRRAELRKRWNLMGLLVAAWLLAVVSRMAAEVRPDIYESHLLYAAIPWVIASLGWLIILIPRLREEG